MLFSQRKGYKPFKSLIQKDAVDEALRHGLWDSLHLHLWERVKYDYNRYGKLEYSNLSSLFQRYQHGYFKQPLDTLPELFDYALRDVRTYFFECKWFEVYDFIEFTVRSAPDEFVDGFVKFCNYVLERELSAYRIVNHQIVEISSKEEVDSIEDAVKNTSKLKGVQAHISSAIAHLSDRKNPDYRNSIKESISAVESLAKTLTGNEKATLGSALKIFEEKANIHPALKKSLSELYGYTSDEDGIRHAILDEPNLTFVDAKFMLVACAAFINYLVGKASLLNIPLK
ncbi:MAG: hypothetical protein WC770_04395 [Phycisphaerae bacterium]|jgi:hypothetical protein